MTSVCIFYSILITRKSCFVIYSRPFSVLGIENVNLLLNETMNRDVFRTQWETHWHLVERTPDPLERIASPMGIHWCFLLLSLFWITANAPDGRANKKRNRAKEKPGDYVEAPVFGNSTFITLNPVTRQPPAILDSLSISLCSTSSLLTLNVFASE
jgi:hypothetical protein